MPVLNGHWAWVGWRRGEAMCGEAFDKTNAICALFHFLDPDEWAQRDSLREASRCAA